MKEDEKAKQCHLPFGTLYFKLGWMIIEMAEGENVDLRNMQVLQEKAREHFRGPYGVIDNRRFSFSSDPIALGNIPIDKNLKAVAIVADRPATVKMVKDVEFPIAKKFMDVPLEVFPELEAAEAWISLKLNGDSLS